MKILVWGPIFEMCEWKALFSVFELREFIYHVVVGDHLPWVPGAMEKSAFPNI